jgi:hypothetical protein
MGFINNQSGRKEGTILRVGVWEQYKIEDDVGPRRMKEGGMQDTRSETDDEVPN